MNRTPSPKQGRRSDLPDRVVLTGFMATGKSTVGRALAQRLGWEFLDTDSLIVERQGRSIAAIFEADGEPAFRQLEADLALELVATTQCVIATGGRLMLDPANATALAADARVFCLQATAEEILRRAGDDAAHRPLLAVKNPAARIRQLLTARAEAYGRFEAVATDGLTPEEVADELVRRLLSESSLRIRPSAGPRSRI